MSIATKSTSASFNNPRRTSGFEPFVSMPTLIFFSLQNFASSTSCGFCKQGSPPVKITASVKLPFNSISFFTSLRSLRNSSLVSNKCGVLQNGHLKLQPAKKIFRQMFFDHSTLTGSIAAMYACISLQPSLVFIIIIYNQLVLYNFIIIFLLINNLFQN